MSDKTFRRGMLRILSAAGLGLIVLLAGAGAGRAQTADLMLNDPTQPVTALVGQSRILQSPGKITRITVGDPKIADFQILGLDRMMLLGKGPGATDLSVWDDRNNMAHYRVEVNLDLASLQRDLQKLFPGARLELTHTQGVYVLNGTMATAEQAERVQSLLSQMAEQSKVKFVNMARLAGVQQVQLKVRMAEVNRTAIRALALNAVKAGDNFFGGLLTGSAGGAFNPVMISPLKGAPATGTPAHGPTIFGFPADTPVNPLVTVLAGFPDSDLELFLQAMAENQYLKLLAEPTLVAMSGEEASFRSGGEFPIPVPQSSGSGGVTITIDYKEYGVGLRFKPTVLGEGAIRMTVEPEVSELSDVGAVTLEGYRVPTILKRTALTTLQMQSGQTFAIAGLISSVDRSRSSGIPGLGSLPLVGALFRTVHHEKAETELLVLVKAELVEPQSPGQEPPLPGAADRSPSDWELYARGQVHGRDAGAVRLENSWLQEHDWDKLRGPGAWASFDQPAPSQAPRK